MATVRTLKGNRFEGHYSLNRHYADINDRKQTGVLLMLTWSDLNELRARLEGILAGQKHLQERMKRFDVAYPQKRGKLVGLNYEDALELRELTGKLAEILQPNL